MCSGLTVRTHRDERLIDFGLRGRRKLDLCFLSGFFQTLQSHLILAQVNAVLFFELVRKVVDDAHVKVFTTQEGVTVGRFHFEEAIVDLENGHVKGTTTKIINRDGLGVSSLSRP